MVTADLPPGDPWERLAFLYSRVAHAVAGGPAVVESGDCTTALGTVAGLHRAGVDPAIVWFDAHGDVQTLETTASGYLGGLPLRLLAGYRPELAARLLPDGPLYVHVDLDVIDSAALPGLRYPAPGGPAPGQVTAALRMILGTGRVAALGIACTWHPGHAAARHVAPDLAAALAGAGGA